jgi:hypothetical protein
VNNLRPTWRDLGAKVPAIEDVVDSAKRAGRRAPKPFSAPTVIYYDDTAKSCVDALIPKPDKNVPKWNPKRLGGGDSLGRVIEVWVPPNAAASSE